jgi:hypothetical protein
VVEVIAGSGEENGRKKRIEQEGTEEAEKTEDRG